MTFKKMREEAGLTQCELARLMGVGQNAVSSWENGKVLPRRECLIKLSDLFGCTIDELVRGGADGKNK